jgi:hypothetical protein
MKATIERATLLKSLGHVQSVVERRNTIPILSNVLIEARDDGSIRLMATDLDLQVDESVPAQVAQASTVRASVRGRPTSLTKPQLTSFPGSRDFEINWLESQRGKIRERPQPQKGRGSACAANGWAIQLLRFRSMSCSRWVMRGQGRSARRRCLFDNERIARAHAACVGEPTHVPRWR